MPIYEYHCNNCDKEFDLLIMRRAEADQQICPNCESADVHRKISAPASSGGASCDNCSCNTPST